MHGTEPGMERSAREHGPDLAPPPAPLPGRRDGSSRVERMVLRRVADDVASFTASEVVQLLLRPAKIAEWAKEQGVTSAAVYNCLSGFRLHAELRDRLAARIGVTRRELDWLIAMDPPEPPSLRVAAPPADWTPDPEPNPEPDAGGTAGGDAVGLIEADAPTGDAARREDWRSVLQREMGQGSVSVGPADRPTSRPRVRRADARPDAQMPLDI